MPFGRRWCGRDCGIAHEPTDPAFQLKRVKEIFYDVPPLPPAVLKLALFCSEYYHYPLGQVLATLLPVRLRRTQPVGALTEARYGLTHAGRDATADALPKRALVKQKLLAALQAAGSLTHSEITRLSPTANKAVQAFAAAGWVSITQEPLTAAPRNHTLPASLDAPTLNPEQQQALDALRAAPAGFSAWLLHGVTGSGKTEVYLHLIEDILARGDQVLVLVPEINLTPQLESRFQARFPQTTIVSLHSNLAEGERLKLGDAQQGAAQIVLRGWRYSRPCKAAIDVVDEDTTLFKQQDGMLLSARCGSVRAPGGDSHPARLGTPALGVITMR